jgi:hypothetical protein
MCYIIKALKDEVSPHILRNVYFAKFQPQISYDLIFWGEESESNRILMLQKKGTLYNERGNKKERHI